MMTVFWENAGALDRIVSFVNTTENPPVERLLVPDMALTAAEYLSLIHIFAGKQAAAKIKSEIAAMIVAKSTAAGVREAVMDPAFIKEMLLFRIRQRPRRHHHARRGGRHSLLRPRHPVPLL